MQRSLLELLTDCVAVGYKNKKNISIMTATEDNDCCCWCSCYIATFYIPGTAIRLESKKVKQRLFVFCWGILSGWCRENSRYEMKEVALQTVPLESSNRLLSRFFSFFWSSNKTLQQQKNNIPNKIGNLADLRSEPTDSALWNKKILCLIFSVISTDKKKMKTKKKQNKTKQTIDKKLKRTGR